MPALQTTDDVIERLGGNIPVARLLRTNPKAVSNWRAFGRFPTHTYRAIKIALKKRGCTAPDSLWPMTEPDFSRKSA